MADESTEQMIPISRLNAKNEQIAALRAELEQAKATAAEAQRAAEAAESLRARVGELEAAQQSAASQWATERALLAAGITDPEIQDAVRYRYERTPEDKRPPLADWLKSEAPKDRILASLLAPAAPAPAAAAPPAEAAPEPAPVAAATPPAPGNKWPQANAGAQPGTPPAGQPLTAATYEQQLTRLMSEKPEGWRQQVDALRTQLWSQ